MKLKPFDPKTDLPPVPFEDSCLQLAASRKEAGLEWTPRVGSLVWEEVLEKVLLE
jgi:hypothetical protein